MGLLTDAGSWFVWLTSLEKQPIFAGINAGGRMDNPSKDQSAFSLGEEALSVLLPLFKQKAPGEGNGCENADFAREVANGGVSGGKKKMILAKRQFELVLVLQTKGPWDQAAPSWPCLAARVTNHVCSIALRFGKWGGCVGWVSLSDWVKKRWIGAPGCFDPTTANLVNAPIGIFYLRGKIKKKSPVKEKENEYSALPKGGTGPGEVRDLLGVVGLTAKTEI